MKLELDLETDHQGRPQRYACLRSALAKIQERLSEGKGAGTFQHGRNEYHARWEVKNVSINKT